MFFNLLIGICVLQNYIAWSHQSIALDSCQTPEHQVGQCIAIDKCPKILQLVYVYPISEKVKNYLLSIQCGFEKTTPKVCCDLSDNVSYGKPHTTSDVPELDAGSNLLPKYEYCQVTATNRIFAIDPELDEFPGVTALQYATPSGLGFHCAGVLINERHILTAAHCVTNLPKGWTLTSVRLGEYDLEEDIDCIEEFNERICSDPPINVKIEESFVHQEFNSNNNQNDIALLRLDKVVQYTEFVRPICLPIFPNISKIDLANTYLIRVGWGLTKNGRESSKMQKLSVQRKSNSECLTENQNLPFTNKQFCVSTLKGSCRGDSGGALMNIQQYYDDIYWYVAGIESFSPLNCNAEKASPIYTSVIDYIPWIINKLN